MENTAFLVQIKYADAEEIAAGVGTNAQGIVWYRWTAAHDGWTYVVPATAGAAGPRPTVKASKYSSTCRQTL